MRSPRGFTLVELLVVIAIIGVLVSMLLPALGKSRLDAKRTVAGVNVRSMTHGFTAYSNDFKGWLKPGNTSSSGSSATGYFYAPASNIDYLALIKDYRLVPASRHPLVIWPPLDQITGASRVWPFSYWAGYSVSDKFATTKVLGGPLRVDMALADQVMFSELIEFRGPISLYWTVEPTYDGGAEFLLNGGVSQAYEVNAAGAWGTYVGMYDGAVKPRRFNEITTWVARLGSGSSAYKLPMLQP